MVAKLIGPMGGKSESLCLPNTYLLQTQGEDNFRHPNKAFRGFWSNPKRRVAEVKI